MLQRFRENNLKLQPDKCEFLRKETIYLNHIISGNGISLDPSKLTTIKEFPTPKKIKEIQSFIRTQLETTSNNNEHQYNEKIEKIPTDRRATIRIRNIKGKINDGASA